MFALLLTALASAETTGAADPGTLTAQPAVSGETRDGTLDFDGELWIVPAAIASRPALAWLDPSTALVGIEGEDIDFDTALAGIEGEDIDFDTTTAAIEPEEIDFDTAVAGIEGEDIDFDAGTTEAEVIREIRRYDDIDFHATAGEDSSSGPLVRFTPDYAAFLVVAVSVDASGATVAEPFELWTVAR